jgi:hypothetical protein
MKIHTQKTAGRNTTGSDRQAGSNRENTSLAHINQITREIQRQGKKILAGSTAQDGPN